MAERARGATQELQEAGPYPGLKPFAEEDSELFFGRERESEVIVANLRARRLTVLYGPSGVGKSSVLRAGVAASLRRRALAARARRHAARFAPVVVDQWKDDPVSAIVAAVALAVREMFGDEKPGPAGTGELAADLQAWCEHFDGEVLLILDQFEELFEYHREPGGSGSLDEALPRVVTREALPVSVLVSLREDALALLDDRFKRSVPGLLDSRMRIAHLDRESARDAIVRPLERYNARHGSAIAIEPALVDEVLDQVARGRVSLEQTGAGAVDGGGPESTAVETPYLQLVLSRLWREAQAVGSSMLRLETLERLGGAETIVRTHLDAAMEALPEEDQDVAADVFKYLVTPSGTKIALRPADLASYAEHSEERIQPVLRKLSERRVGILRSVAPPPGSPSGSRYEIYHDVLAQPVLAWRARRRSEQEVERELEARRRRRARFQRLVALIGGSAALVALLVGFALVQRADASEKSRDARARQLDAAAISLLEDDPELSLLLASESARSSPAPTAEDALRRSLLASHVRDVHATGGPIAEIGFAPDGRHFAFVSDDGRARIVDVETGEQVVARTVGPGGGISFGSILVRGDSGPPRLLELPSGDVRCALGSRSVADAQVAGRYVVVVRNGIGSTWSARTCRLVRLLGRVGQTAVRIVASPDGRHVAFLTGRRARIVDVPSGRVRYVLRHPGEITSLSFSEDGRRIATGGRDRLARIWNGFNGRLLQGLVGHQGQVLDVAIGPGGREVATASTDGTARIWDAVRGRLQAPLFGHSNFVRTVDFSPDGTTVVTASTDGTARTWALNGRRLATLAGHTGPLVDARFSPDGFSVLTGAEDGTVRFWDASTRPELVRSDRSRPDPAATTATSADGSRATVDGDVARLQRRDGTTSVLRGHRLAVNSVAFSPSGERLLTAGRDHDVRLWNVETGGLLLVLRGHFGSVNDARFSGDGRWIVTAGPRSVGVWRAANGELTRLLVGPEGAFTAATFLPDSRTVVTVSEAGVVASYDCRFCGEIPELLRLADERLAATGRELTPEERELYLD